MTSPVALVAEHLEVPKEHDDALRLVFMTMKFRFILGGERVGIQVERQVLSHTFYWEARLRFCTKQLLMLEVVTKCNGDRFRTSGHSRQE